MSDKAPSKPKLLMDPGTNQEVDHVIFIELDALLDTRLGILAQIDPAFAETVMGDPGYYSRVSDDFSAFCDVDDEVYRKAYEARDASVLPMSVVSNIVLTLTEVCRALEHQRIHTTYVKSVTVELNVWPYVLDEETRFSIESAVSVRLPLDTIVRSVFLPIEDLTLARVNNTYSGLILYNFAEWMQYHSTEFKTVQIPGVTVLAPRLHVSGQQGFVKGDLGAGYEEVDPYEAIQALHAPLLGLEFLGPNLFSITGQSEVDFSNTVFHEAGGEVTDEDLAELKEERDSVIPK